MDTLEYEFKAEVIRSSGRKAVYYLLFVPEKESSHITHFASHLTRGFKSLKVDVALEKKGRTGGTAEWRSSIFPSDERYLLLLSKKVRATANLEDGDKVHIRLTILDL